MRVKYSKVPLALSLVFTVSFGWYAVKSEYKHKNEVGVSVRYR